MDIVKRRMSSTKAKNTMRADLIVLYMRIIPSQFSSLGIINEVDKQVALKNFHQNESKVILI